MTFVMSSFERIQKRNQLSLSATNYGTENQNSAYMTNVIFYS